MKGRRAAALLCVLLTHVLLIVSLMGMRPRVEPIVLRDPFFPEPITLTAEPIPASPVASPEAPPPTEDAERERPRTPPPAAPAPPAGVSAAPTTITPPERVDWPIEAKKSATRVLAAEAEAERIAKMFSGPQGTWASLTKRERSRLKKFRWKPGVDGLEYDEKGNAIYHISEGCVLVNLAYIGCTIGKAKVHGDLFKDMQLYFDEKRLPPTDEGNGTEPEALRPAN